jgi:hypothetical protein
MVVFVIRQEHMVDPRDSQVTYLRVEDHSEATCDGVPCGHPAAPDAPAHRHVVVSGEFPLAAERAYATWN